MANITFRIDNVDFHDVLEEGGLVWTRNDLDADGSGRNLAGEMERAVVTSKVTLDVKTIPLQTARISALLKALHKTYSDVTYLDPEEGAVVTKTFYNSECPATCERQYGSTQMWESVNFKFVEK